MFRLNSYYEDNINKFVNRDIDNILGLISSNNSSARLSFNKKTHGYRRLFFLKNEDKLFLKNTYRVLLTRARQGMIIFIPKGFREDITRQPKFYDGTYNYFKQMGLEEI